MVNEVPPAAPGDEELLERARGGDDRAFRELVERYQGVVAATVIGMLGPGDDAEDIGQETFIRFHRALAGFRGDAALSTYLTRIAINLSLTALKRRRRWLERFKAPELAAERVSSDADPEGEREARERGEAVRRAIDTLAAGHKAVVVLRMIDGYSTRETAEILGVPQGTVMSRLARAMKRLETELEGMDI